MSRRFLVAGLPLVAFMVIGTYGLAQLNQGRFDSRERENARATSGDTKKEKREPFDLEKEYELIMKDIDLTKWEPKKIERPGQNKNKD
jgi:hypothetical protein